MVYLVSNGHVTDDITYVTLKGQTRDPNTLRAQCIENSWGCYLATIASLLRGSTVGYPNDWSASWFINFQ